MPELEFDAATHTYSYGEKTIPSVTQIISAMGLYEFDFVSRETLRAAERGTIIHQCVEWYEAGELNVDSIDWELRGYFDAYLKCKADGHLPKPEARECRVFSKQYGYAGTLDQLFPGWINDIKTGQPGAEHGLQLSAYWLALYGLQQKPLRLTGTYLRRDGTYDIIDYPYEPQQWLIEVAAYKWRVKNNKIKVIWK